MNDNRTLIWTLLAALAVVSAGLVYLVTRDERPAAPAVTNHIAAPVQQGGPAARFTRAAQTADPNGFSNVRGGPSVEHPIVGRVEQGETFTTYPQTGQFWEVRTADGTIGYVASESIRIIGDGAMAPGAAEPAEAAEVAQVPAAAVPAAVRGRGEADGMIFPDSDRRLLGPADVAPLTRNELRVARNEIYARRGRDFQDPNLRRYFEQFDWYNPVAAEVALSRVETANVAFLQAAEAGK